MLKQIASQNRFQTLYRSTHIFSCHENKALNLISPKRPIFNEFSSGSIWNSQAFIMAFKSHHKLLLLIAVQVAIYSQWFAVSWNDKITALSHIYLMFEPWCLPFLLFLPHSITNFLYNREKADVREWNMNTAMDLLRNKYQFLNSKWRDNLYLWNVTKEIEYLAILAISCDRWSTSHEKWK